MSKVTFEYQFEMDDLEKQIEQLAVLADKDSKKALKDIGNTVKKMVEVVVPVSDKVWDYRKGQKKPHTHMRNDVKVVVKKQSTTGDNYVSIRGGSKTWQLWHLVDEGHITADGKWVQGINFTDKSLKLSESSIENIIDSYLKGIIDG